MVCRLETRKMQVAPRVKITIPWMELVVAVNSVRLARKVKENSPCRNKVFYRLVCSVGDAKNRVWQVHRVCGSSGYWS